MDGGGSEIHSPITSGEGRGLAVATDTQSFCDSVH